MVPMTTIAAMIEISIQYGFNTCARATTIRYLMIDIPALLKINIS